MAEIAIGQPAPDFTLVNDKGQSFTLSEQRGKSVLLYFYPQAGTPACTDQNIAFTTHKDAFADRGITLVGISPDSVEKLAKFRESYAIAPVLLADPDHEVSALYGAWGEKKNYGRTYTGLIRSTVLVDAEGRIARLWPNIRAKGHVERLLKELR